jgi:hypothetical protein
MSQPQSTTEAADDLDPDICLTKAEIRSLTGYKRRSEQLTELHELGYWRARIDRLGRVRVEREHVAAVCAGIDRPPRKAARAAPELH